MAEAFALPENPLVVIEPAKSWSPIDWADIFAHRELLYFLAWRDLKVRYKQTVLGVAWAILQPIFMMLIFTLLFGRLAGLSSKLSVPYPLFALAGLVPWTFFATAVSTSGNSVVSNTNLITKVYFPRILIPIASVAAAFVDFAMSFVVLSAMMLYYRVGPRSGILMIAPLVLLTFLFALGVGMLFAALNVKYRDMRFVLPFLIQLWLFVSAVIVPMSVLPQKWRWAIALNPMSGIIEGYRAALFGQPFDWKALGVAAAITCAVLVYSAYSFRRMEKNFADVI
jgi:homopolymeric O-antigen transport system permease protein